MDRWRDYTGVETQQAWIWWLIDLLPSPRVPQRRPYQPPMLRHRVVAGAVVLLVSVVILGLVLIEAPNGELIRAVLADVRKQ